MSNCFTIFEKRQRTGVNWSLPRPERRGVFIIDMCLGLFLAAGDGYHRFTIVLQYHHERKENWTYSKIINEMWPRGISNVALPKHDSRTSPPLV